MVALIRKVGAHGPKKMKRIPAEAHSIPFIEAIWPWTKRARERWREKAGDLLDLLTPQAALSAELSLVKRWSALCTPSFLFEIKIQGLQWALHGKNSRERYLDFIEKWASDPSRLCTLASGYEELVRKIELFLDLWIDQETEFLARLHGDLALLSSVFNEGKPLGKVSFLLQDAGDFHLGGRSVFLATFEGGKTVVYKPRDLQMEQAVYSLIEDLNRQGLSPSLQGYRILPRDGYGWEERVEHNPCQDKEAVCRYYERAGMWVGLLYFFYGIDIHFENIIASGENPIPIDLETIFHSNVAKKRSIIDQSVLSTGLLPMNIVQKKGKKGKDLSGLGMDEKFEKIFYRKMHTDEMRQVKRRVRPSSEHQVFCQGKRMRPEDFSQSILRGFRAMHQKIEQNQDLIQEWMGLVSKYPVRTIVLPTFTYRRFLQNLDSPYGLLHLEQRNQVLKILEKGRHFSSSSVVEEEKRALLQGDIPYFQSIPSSHALYIKGKVIEENFWNITPYEQVKQRLKAMDPVDLRMEQEIIEKALLKGKN